MKSVYIFSLLVIVLAACRKDNVISRKIDGTWNVEMLYGTVPNASDEVTFTFHNHRDGEGNGVMTIKSGNTSSTFGLSYFVKNNKLTLIIEEDPVVFSIASRTRKELKLVDSYGDVTLLRKDAWF